MAEMVDATVQGAGLTPGPASSSLSNFIDINGRLYFTFNDGSSGTELWRINAHGRAEMIDDLVSDGGIQPGGDGSSPKYLTNIGGTLYFAATNSSVGTELWRLVPNQPPSDVTLSTLQIAEIASAGTVVATRDSTDINIRESFVYSLVSGTGSADNASFTITGNELRIVSAPNLATQPNYSIRIRIRSTDSDGGTTEKTFSLSVVQLMGSVVNRQVFYNNASGFGTSGVNNAPTVNPVNAIDPTKQALLPGFQTTTTTNFTNYSRGLNGIVVDLNSPGNLSGIGPSSFQFAIWNSFSDGTPNFVPINPVVSVSTFAAGGTAGSDRIKLVFADRAIENAWLRITVLANVNTGLNSNDVFYFGNARFDVTPTSPFPAQQIAINAFDVNGIRSQLLMNTGVVANVFDVDRNGVVNAFDVNAARSGLGVTSLRSFTALTNMPASFALLSVDSTFTDTSWLDTFQIDSAKTRRTRRG
jgi:ELWxxDGT repeat protein